MSNEEQTQVPSLNVDFAKIVCKVSVKIIECVDCEKRFHAKCSYLGIDELITIENGIRDWYCANCKADCDVCSRAVLNDHNAYICFIQSHS